MHKLVHAWGYDQLEVNQRQTWSLAALELLSEVMEEYRGDLAMETRLVPHMMADFTAMSTARVEYYIVSRIGTETQWLRLGIFYDC